MLVCGIEDACPSRCSTPRRCDRGRRIARRSRSLRKSSRARRELNGSIVTNSVSSWVMLPFCRIMFRVMSAGRLENLRADVERVVVVQQANLHALGRAARTRSGSPGGSRRSRPPSPKRPRRACRRSRAASSVRTTLHGLLARCAGTERRGGARRRVLRARDGRAEERERGGHERNAGGPASRRLTPGGTPVENRVQDDAPCQNLNV